MADLTYIEHLNIPIKYRGNILHAYEYNATVGKINEIIDNLQVSYEFSKNFPRFDKIDDIFASTAAGTPVMINNNEDGKLYPITSSAYVLIDNNKNLDDELAILNSQITSGLSDAFNKINQANELIERNLEYSYSRSQLLVSELEERSAQKHYELSRDINEAQDSSYEYAYSLFSETSDKLTEIDNEVAQLQGIISGNNDLAYAYTSSNIEKLSNETDDKLTQLREYIIQLNSELSGVVDELAAQHTIDVTNLLSYIPSYTAGFGINISDDNKVSVNTSDIVDNRSIYINELGQLVVNNEVVLANAESKFKFIDENGNWVGDMANVKNYIDNSISDAKNDLTTLINNNADDIAQLRNDMNTEVTNIYTYVSKYSEYDTFGKDYKLSNAFIQSQE